MNTCNHCHEFLKTTNHTSKIDLQRSFTKINGKLHLGFDRPIVCPTVTDYIPEAIILFLTTNWDLGIFKGFSNVVQLHGRCDYAEQSAPSSPKHFLVNAAGY